MIPLYAAAAMARMPEPASRTGPDPRLGAHIRELEDEVARQRLLLQTMCRLLIQKGLITRQELEQWIQYVDNLDGAADGKLRESKAPQSCPNCNRRSPGTAPKCQYCGHELPRAILFPDPKLDQP